MSEQVATAQPETSEVAGGQAVVASIPDQDVEAILQPVEKPAEPERQLSLDEVLSKVYDDAHAPPKPKAEEKPAPADQAPIAAREPAQSPAIAAPTSWSAEDRAIFEKAPPDVQKKIAERELQVSQLISRQGGELKAVEPLRTLATQLDEAFGRRMGIAAPDLIRSWANAQAILDRDPVSGLRQMAEAYGVLDKLVGQPKQENPVDDLFKDPRVEPLEGEIKALKEYIQRLGGHVQQKDLLEQRRMEAETQRQRADLQKQIDEFAADKPLFREIESEVTHEVALLKAREPGLSVKELIAKGYERAVYANPQTRERMLAEARKAEADKAQKELAAKQAQAKRLAGMNVRTGASASTPTFDGKWDDRDGLNALYDKITTRA